MIKYLPFYILFLLVVTTGSAQTPFISESLVKYDLSSHKADKSIPFDRSFTLVLDKFKAIKITNVHLYEAEMINGNRSLVNNIFSATPSIDNSCCKTYKGQNLKNNEKISAIIDKALDYKADSSGLKIFVNPLKPNKIFDINVIGLLSTTNKATIFQINSLLSQGDVVKAKTQYDGLKNALIDSFISRTYLSVSFPKYQIFFSEKLKSDYDFVNDDSKFPTTNFLTLQELQAISISLKSEKKIYDQSHFIVEVIQKRFENDVQKGLLDIAKVFNSKTKTDLAFPHIRVTHLQSSLKILDSLHQKTDWLIDKGFDKVTVDGNSISLESVRQKLGRLRDNMANNLQLLTEHMKNITNEIDQNEAIRQGFYLAGGTVASDLKSAGGSLLFVDVGLTNIVAPGLKDTWVYIPRLYYGVSIYFRPVDKNTRRSSFPRKYPADKNCGCAKSEICGPDYGVISKATIWQHLCLNIGLTMGAIPNKDFDNFYNNTSLLIGPAYRFKRAFKISAGAALLKRSSENPIISEKQVVIGSYMSLSVDIDFIQSIKDITSILLK
jgi:hypothetical protein